LRRLRLLFHLMRADYLERVRRHAFLVTLGFMAYFAYIALPPNPSSYSTLDFAGHRGIYNSAWVGCLVALMTSTFLSIAGFYLVKNAVEHDRRSGVGQILAATPLSKSGYTLGKWASNLAVLATMVGTLAVCAIGMQLLRGEDRHVDLVAIFAPFLVIALPAMAVTAGMAVLFETIPWLRGGLGNVAYFFVWVGGFMAGDMATRMRGGGIGSAPGVGTIVPSMMRAVSSHFHLALDPTSFNLGFNFKDRGMFVLQTFPWRGMTWTADLLWPRALWAAIGVGLALLAALPFDRFDAPVSSGRARSPDRRGRDPRSREPIAPAASESSSPREARPALTFASLSEPARSRHFITLPAAELKLAIRSLPRAWLFLALGLSLACWLVPLAIARAWILPFAWIWPLVLWSSMGTREFRDQTAPLLFSSPHPLGRQLPAQWLAGVTVAVIAGLGVGARLALGGDLHGVLAWSVGALFIPSLALAAGVWTHSGKLFEILYLLIWYIGPMNRIPFLDFMGTTEPAAESGASAGFATATVALLILAGWGRRHALRR
jgi:hypothetical protein